MGPAESTLAIVIGVAAIAIMMNLFSRPPDEGPNSHAQANDMAPTISSDNSPFVFLFAGSLLEVLLAETFLRAHSFAVYSTGTRHDPERGTGRGRGIRLYVTVPEYRDALEVLIFVGAVDGLHYINATSVLLGRELDHLLEEDAASRIKKSDQLLGVEQRRQTAIVCGAFVSASMTLALSSSAGAAAEGISWLVGTGLLAALAFLPFQMSETRQGKLRARCRGDTVPRAEAVVDLSRQQLCEYAVFLRSFAVLREWLNEPGAQHGIVVDPYESRIVEAIRFGAWMPVVALTDPGTAEVPVAGACRFAVRSEGGWEAFCEGILREASIIVVHLTRLSEGLRREVEIIRRGGLMRRTIFVLGGGSEQVSGWSEEFDRMEVTAAGATIVSDSAFTEEGLVDFIDAVEETRERRDELASLEDTNGVAWRERDHLRHGSLR